MRVITAITVGLLMLFGLPSYGQAQDSTTALQRFVGDWKEDQSQRKMDVSSIFPLRFQSGKDGSLEELRGPVANPTAWPVQFDGKPRTLPNGQASTWKQIDANTFEHVRTDQKGVVQTRRLTISSDGTTLTQLADGRGGRSTTKLKRISGEGGSLQGRWQVTSFESATPFDFRIEAAGPMRLRFSSDVLQYELTVNGQPHPVEPPSNPAFRDTRIARLLADNSLEVRVLRNGAEFIRDVYAVDADGTMTSNSTLAGAGPDSKPLVTVFRKR